MNYAEMKNLLEYYVDDTVDNPIALQLFNEGKNRMAVAAHARFPDIVQTADAGDRFVFDSVYHNAPVLFAAAMVKSYDSSLQEKNSYLDQFEMALRDFVSNYNPPIQYSLEGNMQHYTVTTDTATTPVFRVTDGGYNLYGDITVYVNSLPVPFQKYGSEIRLYNSPKVNDTVTIQWDQNVYGHAQSWQKHF